MSETPRRYSAEEIAKLKLLAEQASFPCTGGNCGDDGAICLSCVTARELSYWLTADAVLRLASQAADDAARLEQIEQWLSVQMSEGELRGYLPDLRDLLSSPGHNGENNGIS